MLLFIDSNNKIIYIMAPKCGTTTIANLLNTKLKTKYNKLELNNLNNPEYKKKIIIRESVVDRFLSGFYEDLFNNTCYNNMDITFDDYLFFLYKCFKEKIPNVNNINIYNGLNIPVWFGNCSNVSNNITNNNGEFCSHIQSQKYAISNIIKKIKCNNVQLVELNNLSFAIPSTEKKNVKKKIENISDDFSISKLYLSYIKNKRIIITSKHLNTHHKEIILEMYDEDTIFIRELKEKFISF